MSQNRSLSLLSKEEIPMQTSDCPELNHTHCSHENEQTTAKKVLVDRYERCSFCSTKLLFTHELNLSILQVVENSRCPGCGVTMQPRRFTLH